MSTPCTMTGRTPRKIGFWPVFALVTGSQIGSGIFMLPASLAPFGLQGLWGWAISTLGALALAFVFSDLCAKMPRTGGPHVYVKEAFGFTAGFFTGWTYWVVSWVSSTAVVVATVGYILPLLGDVPAYGVLVLQFGLLLLVTTLNTRGLYAAGRAEFLLTCLKIVPLVILPGIAFFYFDLENFSPDLPESMETHWLSAVTLLTLWGFIGLESATTPASSIENPTKTIPRAIVLGTASVAVLYLFNCMGIMGAAPAMLLANSSAPYADAAQYFLSGDWHHLITVIAAVVCLGTLNAWTLSSGQVALGLAQQGLLPRIFGKKNSKDAPVMAILLSAIGMTPFLCLTASASLSTQIGLIIDFSVTSFVYVYLACSLARLRFLGMQGGSCLSWVAGLGATGFCFWILWSTPLYVLGISSIFSLVGIPIFLIVFKNKKQGELS